MTDEQRDRRAEALEPEPVPEFVCAEIWGGNRPIDAPVLLPGIRGRVFSRPCAGGRGGDIHYLSICSSGLISRICLADVVGHGERVARVSEAIHLLLRKYMNRLDERRVLSELNQRLLSSEMATMTTAVAATYVPPMRSLTVSYAGHPPAWLYRQKRDEWAPLGPPSADDRRRTPIDLPLGVEARTSFTRRSERVSPGDRLLLLTDGLLEAPRPSGELFSDERLVELLKEHRREAPEVLMQRVLDEVAEHTGDQGLGHDDVTLMVLEFGRGPRAMGVWEMVKNRLLGRRRRKAAPVVRAPGLAAQKSW